MYSTRVSYAVILTAIFLAFFASCVKADMYFLAGVGQSIADLADSNGVSAWQQYPHPHKEDLRSTTYSLGVGVNLNQSLAVEARFHDAGVVSQTGEWRQYDNGKPEWDCPCTGEGSAHIKGITLMGIGRYHFTPKLSAGLEAGAFYWVAPWSERMHFYGDGGRYAVHEPVKARGLNPALGLILGYGPFDVRYEILQIEPRDGNFRQVHQFNLVYKF